MRALTIQGAAAKAGISARLLRQKIAEGQGPLVTRLGRSRSRGVLIREDCLEQWLRSQAGDGSLAR